METKTLIILILASYGFIVLLMIAGVLDHQQNQYDINHDGEVNIVDLSVLAVKISEQSVVK